MNRTFLPFLGAAAFACAAPCFADDAPDPGAEPQPVLGDVDLDGKVTIDDATLLMRYLVEMEDLTDEQLKLADVNRDGKVNIMDVTDIQRFLAEIIKKF